MHVYEVRPRNDKHGVDLISDVLPFGRLWYGEPGVANNEAGYAKFYSRLYDTVIRVYDEAVNCSDAAHAQEILHHGKSHQAESLLKV